MLRRCVCTVAFVIVNASPICWLLYPRATSARTISSLSLICFKFSPAIKAYQLNPPKMTMVIDTGNTYM